MSEERINVYRCPECGGETVTIDVDRGVTPMFLGCRASGQKDDCDGMAVSAMYQVPKPLPSPALEWYKPSKEEIAAMPEDHREHYEGSGLNIRKRKLEGVEE